jgi:hypothetical protein
MYFDNSRRISCLWSCLAFANRRTRGLSPHHSEPRDLDASGEFKRDAKIVGTNSISHLESAKSLTNELETNSKRSPNDTENRAAERRIGRNKTSLPGFSPRRSKPRDPDPSGEFKRDVKIVGTNSISHLESIKAAKNELKTNSKRSRKPCY